MSTLIATRGIPASGKTTWAKGWVGEARESRRRVNRDDLRMALFGVYWGLTSDEEQQITLHQHRQVSYLLSRGFDVVVDDTNLDPDRLRTLMNLALTAGAQVEVKDFHLDVETAIQRDFQRGLAGERYVGADVIRGFVERYRLEDGLPPRPRILGYVPFQGAVPVTV